MPRATFHAYDILARHIDDVVHEWGFQSRSDFFRFTALDFFMINRRMIPPKKVIEDYAKTVSQVRTARRASVTDIE